MIWRIILAWLLCAGLAQADLPKHSFFVPVAQRQAYGFLNGTATMTALLDGNPMPVTTVGTNDNCQRWAQLQLTPGPHQLVVHALNWSGYAPLPLTDGAKIAQSSAWHHKWPAWEIASESAHGKLACLALLPPLFSTR